MNLIHLLRAKHLYPRSDILRITEYRHLAFLFKYYHGEQFAISFSSVIIPIAILYIFKRFGTKIVIIY